jgi:hypothetical protein
MKLFLATLFAATLGMGTVQADALDFTDIRVSVPLSDVRAVVISSEDADVDKNEDFLLASGAMLVTLFDKSPDFTQDVMDELILAAEGLPMSPSIYIRVSSDLMPVEELPVLCDGFGPALDGCITPEQEVPEVIYCDGFAPPIWNCVQPGTPVAPDAPEVDAPEVTDEVIYCDGFAPPIWNCVQP